MNVKLHNEIELIFASNLSMVDPLIFLSPQKMEKKEDAIFLNHNLNQ